MLCTLYRFDVYVHPLKPHLFERYLSALDHFSLGVRSAWLIPGQKISGFRILYFIWFHGITSQYTEFHTSIIPGSALDHISNGFRGPWLNRWNKILGFRIFSSSFGATVISIPNFTLLHKYMYILLLPIILGFGIRIGVVYYRRYRLRNDSNRNRIEMKKHIIDTTITRIVEFSVYLAKKAS